MKKSLLLLLLIALNTAVYSQALPDRRAKQNNGLKSQIDFPIISGAGAQNLKRFGYSANDIQKRIIKDEETGAVSYIRNPSFSNDLKNARKSTREMGFDFLQSVKADLKIDNPKKEFEILEERADQLGIKRIKLQQKFNDIPIYGAELGLHTNASGVVQFMMGKVFPTPEIKTKPQLSLKQAIDATYKDLAKVSIIQKISLSELIAAGEMEDTGELMIYKHEGRYKLVYHTTVRPNIMERWVAFVDAQTGEVIDKYNHTCTLDGLVQASSRDLNNIERQFNALQLGQDYVLLDIGKPMYKSGQSNLPNSPVGAIMTIDARNARVNDEDMDLYHVTTKNPKQWDATAVSAHINASLSYDYFKNAHGRNSLNNDGGNIISVINISDERGRSFDNAFWNGFFMGYGNGGEAFKPLAGGLDVAGHEMTHGVIESTAKLEYRNQSGALNESFADIFGVMIDRNNWTLGEDVVNKSVFPSGALRSLANPNQSGTRDPGYQPMYMSQYQVLRDTPEQDNGGVHINSGIPNHAYYLFATGQGMNKEKAEKVYYHALTHYLGRTSKFVDLRLAVIQSAKDLFGDGAEVSAARTAFDKVGILDPSGGSSGTTPTDPSKESEVEKNPGQAQLVAFGYAQNDQNLYRANFSFNQPMNFQAITNKGEGCLSKPSITDNGEIMVFVGNDQKIHAYDLLNGKPLNFNDGTGLKWYNAAISKDGKRIAAIADETQDNNYIYVFDLQTGQGRKFELYNPTYSQGVNSGQVLYADALEWDLSGEFVVYDAENQIGGWFSQTRTFYDVGVLRAWDPRKNTFGDGSIDKIFSDVPDGVSIGNPTFAKTNSGIMALDYIDETDDTYLILTLDLNRSGDALKYFETSTVGHPDFSVDDRYLMFNYWDNRAQSYSIYGIELMSDKITVSNNYRELVKGGVFGVSFATGERELPQVMEQTISITPIADQSPGSSVEIKAQVSSGLPLIYSINSGDAQISNVNRINLGNTPGRVQAKVSQIGNNQYAATTAETDFCIVPPAPILTDQGDRVTASGGSQYQFYVNGKEIGGYTSNSSLKKDFDGTYTVKAVTSDGCISAGSNPVTFNKVLANEILDKTIKPVPNPVFEVFEIRIPDHEVLEKVEIFDNLGKLRISAENSKINVKELGSGMYLLRVKTDKDIYTSKMIKL